MLCKKIRFFFFILPFLIGTGLSIPLNCFSQKTIIDEPTGITIHLKIEKKMFPDHWYEKPVDSKVKKIPEEEIQRQMDAITAALRKYPVSFFKSELNEIFFIGRMNFFGANYAGTYYRNTLYISNGGGLKNGVQEDFLEGTFHHEFSSILYKNHKDLFPEEEWKKANDSLFEYGKGSINALKSGLTDLHFDSTFMKCGILCEYGAASVEEDLNTYAEALFMGQLDKLVDSFPHVKEKTNLLISFYHKLDSEFTRETFNIFVLEEKIKEEERKALYDFDKKQFGQWTFAQDKSDSTFTLSKGKMTWFLNETSRDEDYIYFMQEEMNWYISMPVFPGRDYFYIYNYKTEDWEKRR